LAKPREQRFQTMEELALALADPQRHASTAPQFAATQPIPSSPTLLASPGVVPDGRADSVVSGRVVFGPGAGDPRLGAPSAPIPSTFLHAKGEILDNDDQFRVAKPRKAGKILALVGVAAAVAGAAAYYLMQPAAEPKEAQVVTAAPAPAPKTVRLVVKSDPPGATVLRRDTSEQLGITPFDIVLPASKAAVELVFKKDAFRDKAESFVPEESGQLAVALVPTPTENPAAPAVDDVPADKPAPRPLTRTHRTPSRKHRTTHSMDEDGVLAPSF
jgi:hypothetical protein